MAKHPDLAIGLAKALAEEFNQLHGETFEDCTPPSLQDVYKAIHRLPESDRRSALCLSGGGIRSASFGLGVLQALAAKKVLPHFHYLSTVSGGGYIGAWLSTWRNQVHDDKKLMKMLSCRREWEKDRLKLVEEQLGTTADDRYTDEDAFKEPVEITALRENSNFLTPKLGAMSADTWTLIALYIRNLLLNWLLYLPLFVAILLVPMVAKDLVEWARTAPAWCHHVILVVIISLYLVAVFTSVRGRFSKNAQKGVSQSTFLKAELIPIYFASSLLCLYAVGSYRTAQPETLAQNGAWLFFGELSLLHFAITGALIYGAGWISAFLIFGDLASFSEPVSERNPMPPAILWGLWSVAGAVSGLLVGFGYDLVTTLCLGAHHPKCVVVFGVAWISVAIFLANATYLAATSYSIRGDVEREWLARSSGWFIAMAVAWGLLSAIALGAPNIATNFITICGVIFGGGLGAIAARIGASAKTISSLPDKPRESDSMTLFLSIATLIFLVALAVALSYLIPQIVDYLSQKVGWNHDPIKSKVAALILCVILVFFLSGLINVNRFSAHGLYRNRLIRAFLGAARGPAGIHGKTRDPFTGFDPNDNARVHDLVFPPKKGHTRLFPVINMALNTVAGANLAWQERKAETFTVTPLHSGNEWVKYWPSNNYCSRSGMSLGTAMAISGAAASPNMGYHSSPLVGLIMTLFNVRLGWWLGNPSAPKTAPLESPPFGMIQFIQELFGITSDKSSYVYLTDGGHFENLGLYEMVRRRCSFILVSDAGCDPNCAFEDLGNAVRKIRIDLGVRISFSKIAIEKRSEPDKQSQSLYCAVGTIKYPESKEVGYLLYLKPCFLGTEPADVRAYAASNKEFPHETTADQFFSESQLESYRALGQHVVETVFGAPAATPDPKAPTTAMARYWAKITTYA